MPGQDGGEEGARPSERTLKVLALAISLGFSLVAVEVALQLADYPRVVSDHGLYLEPHPDLGWRTRAGFSEVYVSDEYAHHLGFDEDGFRVGPDGEGGPEPPLDVLVLGDSFVEGYSVPFGERLSEELAWPGCELSTAAFGVGGFSTVQQLVWLRDNIDRLSPDDVVLMFYFNDVWYNAAPTYERVPKPWATLGRGGTLAVRAPDSVPTVSEDRAPPTPSLLERVKLYRLVERVAKNSRVLRGLAQSVGLFHPPEASLAEGDVPPEFRALRREAGPEVEEAWAVTAELLEAMDSLVASRGGSLLAVYTPMRAEVAGESDALTEVAAERGWELDLVRARFLEICREGEIRCLDLTPPFRQADRERESPLYYAIDTHWNADGHELAAREIARELFQASGC